MVKKHLKFFIKIGISFIFIGFLTYKVNWKDTLAALIKIDLYQYIISTCLTLLSSYVIAYKYYLLIRKSEISKPILRLIEIDLISKFYSLFLPSAIGHDAVRWYKITGNEKGRLFFLAATIFERLTFLFIILLVGFIPLFIIPANSEILILRKQITPVAVLSLLVIFFSIIIFVFQRFRLCLLRIAETFFFDLEKFNFIKIFLDRLSLKQFTCSSFAAISLLSLTWHILFVIRLVLLFNAASITLDFMNIAWIGSLVLFLQTLPVSFAGLGVREGAYAYLLSLFQLPPEQGVLIGILFFSQMLLLSTIGGLLELAE